MKLTNKPIVKPNPKPNTLAKAHPVAKVKMACGTKTSVAAAKIKMHVTTASTVCWVIHSIKLLTKGTTLPKKRTSVMT